MFKGDFLFPFLANCNLIFLCCILVKKTSCKIGRTETKKKTCFFLQTETHTCRLRLKCQKTPKKTVFFWGVVRHKKSKKFNTFHQIFSFGTLWIRCFGCVLDTSGFLRLVANKMCWLNHRGESLYINRSLFWSFFFRYPNRFLKLFPFRWYQLVWRSIFLCRQEVEAPESMTICRVQTPNTGSQWMIGFAFGSLVKLW